MEKTTKIKEIEKRYGVDFGCNSSMKLTTYLRRKGYPSLAEFLEIVEKQD